MVADPSRLTGVPAELIGWMTDSPAPVIALDVPSGIDSTTAAAAGVVVKAATTMTLAPPSPASTPPWAGCGSGPSASRARSIDASASTCPTDVSTAATESS